MLLTSKAPASNATCNMLAERGIAKAAEAIYANANAADRAGTAGAAGASMPRGQLWKMTSLEALLVDGCGWRVVEPQAITNCCDFAVAFLWFPVVSRCSADFHSIQLPSCKAAKRFSNSDHSDLPADLVFIDADHSEALRTCHHSPAMPSVFQRADTWLLYFVVCIVVP